MTMAEEAFALAKPYEIGIICLRRWRSPSWAAYPENVGTPWQVDWKEGWEIETTAGILAFKLL